MIQVYQGRVFNSIVAEVDNTSSLIDGSESSYCSVQVIWTGLTSNGAIDSVLKVQGTNDQGTTWTDISGATKTISTASGSDFISITDLTCENIRLVYTKNSVTDGNVTAYVILKG